MHGTSSFIFLLYNILWCGPTSTVFFSSSIELFLFGASTDYAVGNVLGQVFRCMYAEMSMGFKHLDMELLGHGLYTCSALLLDTIQK